MACIKKRTETIQKRISHVNVEDEAAHQPTHPLEVRQTIRYKVLPGQCGGC